MKWEDMNNSTMSQCTKDLFHYIDNKLSFESINSDIYQAHRFNRIDLSNEWLRLLPIPIEVTELNRLVKLPIPNFLIYLIISKIVTHNQGTPEY
jgi:hypothetical protein